METKAKVKKVDTFKSILKRNNSKIQDDRAKRISEVAQMDYEALVNAQKKKVFEFQNAIEEMADLSSSNVTTTDNRIKAPRFDSEDFVKERARLRLDLVYAKEELAILEEDKAFYA